jgi:hypothetical protein
MSSENFPIHQNPHVFFPWLKKLSEKVWENIELKQGVFGFQIQKGTKWNSGLTEDEIEDFEKELGLSFPEIYKFYLRYLNGTDKDFKNIYGNGMTEAFAPGFYSFPRDLDIIKDRINIVYKDFLVHENFVRSGAIPRIIPIVSHRFLIVDGCAKNPVLSIHQRDAMLYAPTLESFLVADIFENSSPVAIDESEFQVDFWFDDYLKKLNG